MTTRTDTEEQATPSKRMAELTRPEVAPDIGRWNLLPHEWIFGLFLVITWLRLTLHLGALNPYSLIFLGGLAGAVATLSWAETNPTPARWRLRLLYYPVIMGITFYTLGGAIPALGTAKVDAPLLNLDRAILGETPAVSYQTWNHPWLNDTLMLGYLFFFIHLVAIPGAYCVRDIRRFRQCIVGLFTIYGIGFLSYTLLPAGGPHRWMTFETPLTGPFVIPATLAPVNSGSNGVDVFPSLHFAISLYLLVFDWWHERRRFWLCLVPCLILWCSTVLLRFHYFVDLIGGLAVALIGLFVAARFEKSRQSSGGQAQA